MTFFPLFAVLVAAGQGRRLGGDCAKAYRRFAGRSLLARSVGALCAEVAPEHLQIVIDPSHHDAFLAESDLPAGLRPVCYGGANRWESVQRGLHALQLAEDDRVVIHDAARPFASAALLRRLRGALEQHSAVIPAVPLVDALKRCSDGTDLPRAEYCAAQTPQGFHYRSLQQAARRCPGGDYPDEAAWVADAGLAIHLLEGEAANVKITYPEDLARAHALEVETVFGNGFDLHCFDTECDGAHDIALGGLALPHRFPLIGHSDGDVVLHALVDAMLGTIAGGDIGQHFPPNDPAWRDQDSRHFLDYAQQRLAQASVRLLQVDVTIIADAPKIAPHRTALQNRLQELLALEVAQVGVKATTTEGLGFIAARNAIAAQVMVSVERPRVSQ